MIESARADLYCQPELSIAKKCTHNMITAREIISTILFIIAILLPFDMMANGFHWVYLAGSLLFFVLAYLIWPSKKKGQREGDNWVVDSLEFVIELPIELMVGLFRFFVRVLDH